MSVILGPLPKTVRVGGRDVAIETDFKAGIRFELMTLDETITPDLILTNYYGAVWPEPYDEALKAILWFYQCGADEKIQEKKGAKALKNFRRSYDFEVDAEVIYSSFWQAYGIDLGKTRMHWWAFRSLLLGLPEDTPFMQRVYYRVGSTKGMSKKQKKDFEERRKRYQLPERGAIDHKLSLMERDAAIRQYVADRFAEAHKKTAEMG